MKNPSRNSGRRFEALALLDGQHSSPEGFQGWTSAALAETFGVAWSSAHHLLARMKKYGLVADLAVGQGAQFRRALKGDRTLVGRMPGRTLIWKLTEKGEGRLRYIGGHGKWCPLCRIAGKSNTPG